jgi:beta-galactosidase
MQSDGRRRQAGSRRHTCPTSRAYREESARVVTELASRYGSTAAVTTWQVDNEPGNHDSTRCWCEQCATAFRGWLSDRYGTVEALNAAWGTVFWSQVWPSFDAVELPRATVTAHNPSLELAHRRFASDQVTDALREQVVLLRQLSPGRRLLTNHYLGDAVLDCREIGRLTGTVGHDNYPHGAVGPYDVGFRHDLCRGLADGAAPWVVEQQPGPVNWTPTNPPVPPGQVRLWGWQAALHGVDTLLFFRWRAGRFGQEQYHAGLLRHDASPDRGLEEAVQLGRELRDAAPELLVRPAARTALTYSYDDAWAIEIDPHLTGLTHRELVLAAHEAAARCGQDVDVVDPEGDLTGYAYVLAPALHLCTPRRLAALEAALDAGATVVLGPRSLVKDRDDVWLDEPLPGGLASRLGARVADTLTEPTGTVQVAPYAVIAGPWTDVYEVLADDVEVLATYDGGWLTGRPAAVRCGGLVAAGFASGPAWTQLLSSMLGVQPAPSGVEVFRRGSARIRIDWRDLTMTTGQVEPSPGAPASGGDS